MTVRLACQVPSLDHSIWKYTLYFQSISRSPIDKFVFLLLSKPYLPTSFPHKVRPATTSFNSWHLCKKPPFHQSPTTRKSAMVKFHSSFTIKWTTTAKLITIILLLCKIYEDSISLQKWSKVSSCPPQSRSLFLQIYPFILFAGDAAAVACLQLLYVYVYFWVYFNGTNGQMIALQRIFAWPGQARRDWVAGGGRWAGAWVKCVLMQMRATLVTRWANALHDQPPLA